MELKLFFEQYRHRFQKVLEKILISRNPPAQELRDAFAYTLLGGGKRLRPLLVYSAGLAFNADPINLDFLAASVEIIHIYSLIHDDLPALDNDDLRHGRPSCHKQFGENIAIVVGDALQSLCFEILSQPLKGIEASRQLQMLHYLTRAIGDLGMVGGQVLDLQAENKSISLEELQTMHQLKTGALLKACVVLGALAGDIHEEKELPLLERFASHMGLMFQIHDDVLDITSSTEKLGKPQGSDVINQKSTYVSLLGLEKSIEMAHHHYQEAQAILQRLEGRDLSLLLAITKFMIERDH